MTWMNEEQRALAKREAQEARNEAYRKAALIARDYDTDADNEYDARHGDKIAAAIEAEITE